MKPFRMTLMAIATMTALSAGAQTREGLQAIVDKANAACPVVINQGFTQESVALNDSAIVYTVQIDPSIGHIHEVESRKQLLHDGKSMELATDTNANALAPYCTKLGISVIYHFTDGTDSFDIVITPKDMTF